MICERVGLRIQTWSSIVLELVLFVRRISIVSRVEICVGPFKLHSSISLHIFKFSAETSQSRLLLKKFLPQIFGLVQIMVHFMFLTDRLFLCHLLGLILLTIFSFTRERHLSLVFLAGLFSWVLVNILAELVRLAKFFHYWLARV